MLKKHFYSSGTTIILPPLSVFLINIALMYFFGIKAINENRIDNILHIAGGGTVCLSSAGILWHLIRREIVILEDAQVFRFVIFGFLCFIVISWELFEYLVFYPDEFLTYTDTMSDVICGLVGGFLTILFIEQPFYAQR